MEVAKGEIQRDRKALLEEKRLRSGTKEREDGERRARSI